MIEKRARRVVIINNIESETIDQAIFILKSDNNFAKSDINVANEAQKIISNYIKQVERIQTDAFSQKNRRRKRPAWLKFLVISGLISLIIYFTIQAL